MTIRSVGRSLKRFAFPLEKALEIRQLRKLLAEEKLGEAEAEEGRVRDRLSRAVGEQGKCFGRLREAMSGQVDPGEMRQLLRYRTSVEDEILRQTGDLVRKQALTKEAMDVVVVRTQEERTLEKHRENRLHDYMARFWWEEAKQMDEVGSQRFTRTKER